MTKTTLEQVSKQINTIYDYHKTKLTYINENLQKIETHLKELNGRVEQNTHFRYKAIGVTKTLCFIIGSGIGLTILLRIII
jgi:hypothetical protein